MEKKKLTKKATALLVSLVLLLTVTVGSTLAYLIDRTDPVVNMFAPSKVTVEVQETFTNNVKSNVTIKNTGDIPAYIRAAVVITWQDDAGNVYGKAPVAKTDYTTTGMPGDWKEYDGFYYWPVAVSKEESTGVLIGEVKPIAGKAPEGYFLCVEILASGIQADGVNDSGTKAVEVAWGVDPTKLGKEVLE